MFCVPDIESKADLDITQIQKVANGIPICCKTHSTGNQRNYFSKLYIIFN